MRDRVWRYLVAPEDYDWLGASLVELNRLSFSKSHPHPPSRQAYYQWLHGTRFASSRTRYSRLDDDIRTDLATMPAVFASICAVEEVDRRRSVAIKSLTTVERSLQSAAAAQVSDNNAVVAWFAESLAARYDSYSYALDHLLVETPHEQAIGVDADLSQLNIYLERASDDDFCLAAPSSTAPAPFAVRQRVPASQDGKGS